MGFFSLECTVILKYNMGKAVWDKPYVKKSGGNLVISNIDKPLKHGREAKRYICYKVEHLNCKDNESYYRRYYCFITYVDNFEDKSFKVRAVRELIILYEGTDKNIIILGKKIQERDSEKSD